MASLRRVYDTRQQKPTLFICALALYQSAEVNGLQMEVGRQLSGPIRDAPFVKALMVSHHFIAVRNSKEDLYTRAWCLVELVFAKKLGFFERRDNKAVSITGPNAFANGSATSCLDV